MARLTSCGCDERASLDAGGSGLSLNFCSGYQQLCRSGVPGNTHLVQGAPVLVQPRVYGLEVTLGGC